LKKLVLFENADIVAGFVGTKVMMHLIPFIEAQRAPVILSNLGADLPGALLHSQYLFYNSLHLWKSEWAMGKWMQCKYGGEPSVSLSLYESGYGLHECFKTGAAAAGAQTMKLNMVKNMSALPDTRMLISYLQEQQPRHAHILLSGKEGEQFLDLFFQSGLSRHMALSVNPFITGESLCRKVDWNGRLHSALTWYGGLPTPGNELFTRLYRDNYGVQPNVISLLGYETGLVLAAAVHNMGHCINRKELAMALSAAAPQGPRGKINMGTCPLRTGLPVYIQSSDRQVKDQQVTHRVEEEAGIEWSDPLIGPAGQSVSGWQNPYLCV